MSAHRTVVAGGAGFLGSHLCDLLVERGDHVICVDDFSTGSVLNIAHLIGDERFQLLEHDIVERGLEDRVHDALDGAALTRVLNLASPASPPEYLRRPIDTLDAGSTGTRHLLDLADRYGARFFLASTSEVYGDPLEHPQTESYWGNVNPIGERSVYDEAKRFAEALTMAYHRTYGLDVRIARIFNTYGPRMQADDGRVVTNFVNQALDGDPITIYGDGTQTRSFCYVDDEVRGLLAVLEGPLVGPVNVGNPREFTMLELADRVLGLTGSASRVVHHPLPPDDPKLRRPDIALARDVLGWEPCISLEAGLSRTVAWFRDGVYPRHSAHVG
jgi:nucleoside-diphosphate-sugar epimerase